MHDLERLRAFAVNYLDSNDLAGYFLLHCMSVLMRDIRLIE